MKEQKCQVEYPFRPLVSLRYNKLSHGCKISQLLSAGCQMKITVKYFTFRLGVLSSWWGMFFFAAWDEMAKEFFLFHIDWPDMLKRIAYLLNKGRFREALPASCIFHSCSMFQSPFIMHYNGYQPSFSIVWWRWRCHGSIASDGER